MGYEGVVAALVAAVIVTVLTLPTPLAPWMRAWYLAANMIEERRINDELRHGYHWNEEKTVLDVLPDYSICSFLAHDSALFRLALTLKYDAVVDAVRDHVKALTQDLSFECALGGYEIPQAQRDLLQWRMYLQRVVADAIIAGDIYALESLQRRGEIGDAFPHMPITVLVRADRRNDRLTPWLNRFFRHLALYDALMHPPPFSSPPPRAI